MLWPHAITDARLSRLHQWHIDSPHEAPEHRPAHAVNVLLALADIPLEAGPTEVACRSHTLTNHHLAPELLDRDDLLYQTECEITPDLLERAQIARGGSEAPVGRGGPQAMRAGDCLVFDDRILHRGLANQSGTERWVAYFSCEGPPPSECIRAESPRRSPLGSPLGSPPLATPPRVPTVSAA